MVVIAIICHKSNEVKTQLPYDYYTLPFCRPSLITPSAENLGEILEGDRIEPFDGMEKKKAI